MRIKALFLSFFLFLSFCSTMEIKKEASKEEQKIRPKVALVLSGGSTKGFAHVGVIRVLEQEKIPIDLIVGTSVGSLIGGLYASNPDSFQLEWISYQIERNDIFDFSLLYSKLGPVQGERLENFVERVSKGKKVEETVIPFFPVATDLNTGETVILNKGPLSKAIRASCAIPGIFVPVQFGGRMLVDGGVTNNVPADIAKNLGADVVIAVNLLNEVKNYNIDSLFDIIFQSISIMMQETTKAKLRYADVVIEPKVGDISILDFSKKKALIEEGIRAAKRKIPEIKTLIDKYK